MAPTPKQQFLNSLKQQLLDLKHQATPLKRKSADRNDFGHSLRDDHQSSIMNRDILLEQSASEENLTDYYPQRRLADDFTISCAAKRRKRAQLAASKEQQRDASLMGKKKSSAATRPSSRRAIPSRKRTPKTKHLAFGKCYRGPSPSNLVEAPKRRSSSASTTRRRRYRKKLPRARTPTSSKKLSKQKSTKKLTISAKKARKDASLLKGDSQSNDIIWMRQQQQIEHLNTRTHTMRKQMKKIIRELKKMNQILPVENLQHDMDNIIEHQKQIRGFVRSRMKKLMDSMSNVNQEHSHQRVEMEKLIKIYTSLSSKTNHMELEMNKMQQENTNELDALKRETDHRLCNLEQKSELFENQMNQMRKHVYEKTQNIDFWRESLQNKRQSLRRRESRLDETDTSMGSDASHVQPAARRHRIREERKAASAARRQQYLVDVDVADSSAAEEATPIYVTPKHPILDSSSEESISEYEEEETRENPSSAYSDRYDKLKRAYLKVFRETKR